MIEERKYPKWATPKQLEGMKEFFGVADEYGSFEVSFKQSDFEDDEETRFYAVISWGVKSDLKKHTFDIAYNYEPTWDYLNEPIEFWQFLFSGGDCTREISAEVFFMDLFWYLDNTYLNQIKANHKG